MTTYGINLGVSKGAIKCYSMLVRHRLAWNTSFPFGTSRFHFPLSPVLCFFYLFSFMSFLITSLHLSFGVHPLPSSIKKGMVYIAQYPVRWTAQSALHFHVLISTSSSVFLSTWPNHLSLASLNLSLVFATPALALLHSSSSQSSLFPPSISIFSSLFFLPSFARPFSVPRSHFPTLEYILK